ncbi:MAG: serine/threonine-protein kinase [Pirellulales bacterium]
MSAALKTWTIHGSVSLADHLHQSGVIGESDKRRLSQEAAARLAELLDGEGNGGRSDAGNGAASKTALFGTLDAFDPSGTIARLLGIRGVAGATTIDATGARQSAARFRLVRKLGQGGLGRVWLAFDEGLRRHVAVKEITVNDNPAAVERFRREAEITGRLEHPGIVPIYQLGSDTQTGEAFYAMRFLGKTTLQDSIAEYHERRGEGDDDPMLIRRLLTAFVSICQAIGHAHSRKVIHRDLKPENIAIDSFGQVIVIDWGIAKVIDDLGGADDLGAASAGASSESTMQGQVLGTPFYMAPEQAAGRVDELDERTDIYGLGAILFAILTGFAPHERTRDSSGATSGRQLLAAIAGRPTPNAAELHPEVDPALAAICAKAMARRQYARYQSASELADDVQRWMARESVSAYRERPSQRVARWVQQHRLWSQAILAAAIVGVVALATFAIASRQGALAARQVRFDEMRSFAREIELEVKLTAEGLAKDARFMSTLPPIQGIIDARGGDAENDAENEGEEVWRGRLDTIYEGLLRANRDYLAVSFVSSSSVSSSSVSSSSVSSSSVSSSSAATSTDSTAAADAGSGANVVRVERNASDSSYVRRVPASRLRSFADAGVFAKTSALPPGEVMLSIVQVAATESNRPRVRLIASTAVYDEKKGTLFGIVAVEINFTARLTEILEAIEQRDAAVYVADSGGNVWITDDPDRGVDIRVPAMQIGEVIAGTEGFFNAHDKHVELNRDGGWVARQVLLDPAHGQTSIGVVLRLLENE